MFLLLAPLSAPSVKIIIDMRDALYWKKKKNDLVHFRSKIIDFLYLNRIVDPRFAMTLVSYHNAGRNARHKPTPTVHDLRLFAPEVVWIAPRVTMSPTLNTPTGTKTYDPYGVLVHTHTRYAAMPPASTQRNYTNDADGVGFHVSINKIRTLSHPLLAGLPSIVIYLILGLMSVSFTARHSTYV